MRVPQNVQVARVDGHVDRVTWDDPNTTTRAVRVFTGQTGGAEVPATKSVAARWAYLPVGTYWLELKDATGQVSPRAKVVTAPVAPHVMTAADHVAAALGVELMMDDELYFRVVKDGGTLGA